MNMQFTYYINKDTGYFINLINDQIGKMVDCFYFFTLTATEVIKTIIYLIFAFIIAWKFGLMATFAGLILLFFFKSLNIYVRNLSRNHTKEQSNLSKLLIQAIQAYKYILATNETQTITKNIKNSIFITTNYEMKTGIASAFTQAIREPIAVILIIAILAFQILYVKEPIFPIFVSILLFYRGLNSILTVQASWQNTMSNIGSLEILNKEINNQEKFKEVKGKVNLKNFIDKFHLNNL